VGGSLLKNEAKLHDFCKELGEVMARHLVLVVPGGGAFADLVRKIDERLRLKPLTSHLMALLAMEQYGLLLADLIPNVRVIARLSDLDDRSALLLPYVEVREDHQLPPSWSVTSDAIAARIAERLGISKLLLVKDVEGVVEEGKLLEEVEASKLMKARESCIDTYTPVILIRSRITCYVLSGLVKGNLQRFMEGLPVRCTRIIPE